MKFNNTLETILREQCRRVGADFEKMDFGKKDWFLDYSWTTEEERDFKEWMINYLLEDKKRLKDIFQHPTIMRNRKQLSKALSWFLLDYSWKYKNL